MPVAAILACLVIGIADGDTLTARCATAHGEQNIRVRLAEIDAPEKGQAFGQSSKQHLAALCFRKRAEVKSTATDRYGRTIARVHCEGVDANALQVRAGMARAFTRYLTDPMFRELEREARDGRRGLWADAHPMPPWEWRRAAPAPRRWPSGTRS
jgi:micrococcal nuclease